MKAPDAIETKRLLLRRPRADDAAAIFERYARDPEVTRFVAFRTHSAMSETQAFLAFSEAEWERWPVYLILSRADGTLLGGSGLAFETSHRAATGYILAKDAWGQGYATETLEAMVALAPTVGVQRLYALCHPGHRASWRVLEKCGLTREATLRRHSEFPNLAPGIPSDVFCYATIFD